MISMREKNKDSSEKYSLTKKAHWIWPHMYRKNERGTVRILASLYKDIDGGDEERGKKWR